jgi:spermidine synthase
VGTRRDISRSAANDAGPGKTTVGIATPRVFSGRVGPVLFSLFFLSGFCSLLYQVVWLRMAFARFGVITPVLSIVLSVFMLGLGIGSIFGGRWAAWGRRKLGLSPAYLYGGAELTIGLGAFVVPWLFQIGADYLLDAGETSSGGYLFGSAIFITAAILPWCIMMGATLPLMMSFVGAREANRAGSFGFLYLANVMGASAGTVITALVLVETFGFRETYVIAATINFVIAATSFALARACGARSDEPALAAHVPTRPASPTLRWSELVLFTTGFTSLAMEVVWTRAFTFVLKTTIYAFASIIGTYLVATWIGSYLYRRGLNEGRLASIEAVLGTLCIVALLPAVLNDPRFNHDVGLTLASIVPFCMALGYLTPRLIDECSSGDPVAAGRLYCVNIAGGIVGPLVAAYALLPVIGSRAALIALSVPMFALFAGALLRARTSLNRRLGVAIAYAAVFAVALTVSRDYEDGAFYEGPHEIRRDRVASVSAFGEGMKKQLLVNGVGMTSLTPITKVMAHLPLAAHDGTKSGLIICFGMGTTFRAMHSWSIDTTVVELSPSVVESFGFFFPDYRDTTGDAKSHIVVDDGRRYLLRSNRTFDIITLDPPPPIEAAASSLLYSREFYEIAKVHLAPGGIVQQWFPGGDDRIQYAVARALRESFPHVIAFRSIDDWGYHFLASSSPIPEISPAEFVARLPASARRDLMEWNTDMTIEKMVENILSRRTAIEQLLPPPGANMIVTDDRPYNEYFYLRRNWLSN